jgi:O-antigen/teichoic acid export membrane protein
MLLRIWSTLGIDRAISLTLAMRAWSAISSLISLWFIAQFLSPDEQGFYYTFINVLGIQVFFELGLTYVVLQTASHEMAHLAWKPDMTLDGDQHSKSRLGSLLRFSLAWYFIVSLLIITVVLPLGIFFFSSNEPAGNLVSWRGPWTALVIATGMNICLSPILAIIEGCGLVAKIAMLRLAQIVGSSVLAWGSLWSGFGLYAAAISTVTSLAITCVLLGPSIRRLVRDIFSAYRPDAHMSWRQEIWPFQWRIALSWLSGYLIFQLLTPVLFAYQGPRVAGQVGMSLSITSALSSFAMSWISTKAPNFGILVARKEYRKLDILFFRSLGQSLAMAGIGALVLALLAFYAHNSGHHFSGRIVNFVSFSLLILIAIINHVVNAEALYLRAHKKEPFLGLSILGGIAVGVVTFTLGRISGADAVILGYFLLSLIVGLGLSTWVFVRKRHAWHAG